METQQQLFISVKNADIYTTKYLINTVGVDVNVRDKNYKKTAMHKASSSDGIECIKFLIDANADINVRDINNITPLHEASYNGKLMNIQLLIKFGADPFAKDKYDRTPLHIIMERGYMDCAKWWFSYIFKSKLTHLKLCYIRNEETNLLKKLPIQVFNNEFLQHYKYYILQEIIKTHNLQPEKCLEVMHYCPF